MKLNNFAYSYSKPLRNHTLKIMKIIPGNLLKNLEKSWKYDGILSARKSGNPVIEFQVKLVTNPFAPKFYSLIQIISVRISAVNINLKFNLKFVICEQNFKFYMNDANA